MTVLAGTPNHRFSADRHSRLDESATAVIVLQRGFFSLPEYRPDWILKVTSLFSSTNGTFLNRTKSQRLPRITALCNVSHQLNSLKVFSLRSRTLKNLQWIVLVSSTIVSTDYSLTTNCSHFSRSTGISSHFSHRTSHFFLT